jgi:hypothetical protein
MDVLDPPEHLLEFLDPPRSSNHHKCYLYWIIFIQVAIWTPLEGFENQV